MLVRVQGYVAGYYVLLGHVARRGDACYDVVVHDGMTRIAPETTRTAASSGWWSANELAMNKQHRPRKAAKSFMFSNKLDFRVGFGAWCAVGLAKLLSGVSKKLENAEHTLVCVHTRLGKFSKISFNMMGVWYLSFAGGHGENRGSQDKHHDATTEGVKTNTTTRQRKEREKYVNDRPTGPLNRRPAGPFGSFGGVTFGRPLECHLVRPPMFRGSPCRLMSR